MTSVEIWQYLHVLMFVFWVGTDMGVMLSARKSTDSRLTLETRLMLVKMALLIELLPRTMWAMALPFGVVLSRQVGLLEISDTALAGVWIFTLAWVAISLGGAHFSEKPFGQRLAAINRWIIGVLGIGLAAVGAWSYFGDGPFDSAWLAAKVGLYGLINLTVLGIEAAFVPVGPAFGRLFGEGSTPAVEAAIAKGMRTTMFWVYASYILILIVGFIGVAKPAAISIAFLAYFTCIALAASAAFTGMGRMLRSA
jgi:hypothetical protein